MSGTTGPGHLARRSEIRYARSRDANIAHRVIASSGDRSRDILLVVAGTLRLEALRWRAQRPVRLQTVDGAGHLLTFEEPDIVAEAVIDFLGSNG